MKTVVSKNSSRVFLFVIAVNIFTHYKNRRGRVHRIANSIDVALHEASPFIVCQCLTSHERFLNDGLSRKRAAGPPADSRFFLFLARTRFAWRPLPSTFSRAIPNCAAHAVRNPKQARTSRAEYRSSGKVGRNAARRDVFSVARHSYS